MGIVLLVATVVAITRDYSASTNIAVPENNTDQSEKADNKPVAEDKKDTTTPASEKVDEKTTPATEGTSNNNKTTENKESDKLLPFLLEA